MLRINFAIVRTCKRTAIPTGVPGLYTRVSVNFGRIARRAINHLENCHHGGGPPCRPDKRADYLSIDGEPIDASSLEIRHPCDPYRALRLYPMNPVLSDSCFYEDRTANESIRAARVTLGCGTRIAIEIAATVSRWRFPSFSFASPIQRFQKTENFEKKIFA